jgi:two-component system, sensor histidine kinase PdtaS
LKGSVKYIFIFIFCALGIKAQLDKEKFYYHFSKADLEGKLKLAASLPYDDLKEVYPSIKDTLEIIKRLVTNQEKDYNFTFNYADANFEINNKNFEKAAAIVENTLLHLSRNLKDSILCYRILKLCYFKIRNFIKAYEVNTRMEKLWERKPDTIRLNYGINKSGLFASLHFVREAIDERRNEFNKLPLTGYSHNTLPSYYNDMGVYFNQLGLSDSAEIYFLKAYHILNTRASIGERKTKDKFFKALVLGNLGQTYFNQGKIQKAIPLIKGDAYHSRLAKNYESAFNAFHLLSTCYLQTEDYLMAKIYLDSTENLLKVHNDELYARIKFLQLATLYHQAINNYKKANHLFKEYFVLKDSISKIEIRQAIGNSENAFKIEQSERQLNDRTKILEQKELGEARQKTFNAYLLTGIVFLLGIIAILVLINYYSKKRENELQIKNGQIEHQKIQIEQSLKEKEILIKEIHHRVKNNLQLIISMLNLQISKEAGTESEATLLQTKNRINSIALTHQMLHQNPNLSDIPINDYVEKLVRQIESSIMVNGIDLITEYKSNNRQLNIDDAVPLGLLINEILTNAFKHAFPNNQKGIIKVRLTENKKGSVLSISDNGIGLPEDINLTSGSSMGMDLIHILAEQLDAQIQVENSKGSRFVIEFPKERLYV